VKENMIGTNIAKEKIGNMHFESRFNNEFKIIKGEREGCHIRKNISEENSLRQCRKYNDRE
jgi:hypothetical protein